MKPLLPFTMNSHWLVILLTVAALSQPLCAAEPAATPLTPVDFRVTTAFPKHVTADVEFRDPSGAKWPNFFYGKPADESGRISLNAAKPEAAFALTCEKMAQPNGDQSRKVLGELCPPGQPPTVSLAIQSMGLIQAGEASGKNKGANTATLQGVLEVAGRKVPVKLVTTLRHHSGKGDEKNIALMLDGHTELQAGELGLKALPPATAITIRFGLTAYPPKAAAAGDRRD